MAQDRWRSRAGFIFSAMGSAIGLGSIWKFPYEVGANGGGGFLAFYLLGLALIVFPLLLLEFAIGRQGGSHAIASLAKVAAESRASGRWALVGLAGVVGSILILSYYSVIGGWALAYVVDTAAHGLPGSAELTQARLDALLGSPLRIAAYHLAFMGLTAVVVARGIANGIERASLYLMPVLMVLVILLAAYSSLNGDLGAAARFLFGLDPGRLTPRVALEAIGLGFFSIGVGLAVMITYAAYADPAFDLRDIAIITLVSDTAISVLAGLAVFPVVFAEGLDPASGPGLMYVTLPLAFARIPFGAAAAAAFFLLLSVAAVASAISLLEMPVALAHRELGWSRPRAAVVAAALCWALGLPSVLSFNLWAEWRPLAWLPGLGSLTVFDALDHLASNVLLPLGGLALALFGGWVVPPRLLMGQLGLSRSGGRTLVILLRYVVPAGIAAASVLPIF
ncbi:MAG TPA: sodium-dependent transporter [Methylomirabilota bacterium]|nr:sodium-dependent transporter [Methylomirabilota bacterium]